MNVTIHRGAKEIGGSCVELKSEGSRLLVDFGMPLTGATGEKFDAKSLAGKTISQLIADKVLLDIGGLYGDGPRSLDGILISHYHLDHYGLLDYVDPAILVFMSKGTKLFIEAAHFFGQTKYQPKNAETKPAWEKFPVGRFQVTRYPIPHSAMDASAFLIECDGKRIFYSGDFNAHGRTKKLFDHLLARPPKDIDYLLLEGTTLGRTKPECSSESEVEKRLIGEFKKHPGLVFCACSSQNLDRLVSLYRACLQSKRTLVIDPYTAYILEQAKAVSPNIPQFDWKSIRVYFAQSSHTQHLAETKDLFHFKGAKVTLEEVRANQGRLVVKDSWAARHRLLEGGGITNARLIFSMWEGYLKDVREFWDSHGVKIEHVHSSGHAYEPELKQFVSAISPKKIIPIHTDSRARYKEIWGERVLPLEDGQEYSCA
jgi:ribonuclease J